MKYTLIVLLFFSYPSLSSSLLGGEITCRNINGLMYETTLTIYRDTVSGNTPSSYTITYRDSLDTIIATHIVVTPPSVLWYNGFKSYNYIDTINFPYAGTFKASAWSCCRDSVDNIPNSTSAGMYLECMIMADGNNSSPKFLNVPITLAQLNNPFTNNITPYDADRDSMSWELTIPEDLVNNGSGGINIISLPYNYPPADSSLPFHIDSLLGDILFKPNLSGKYQIAIKLLEWRNGLQIGYVKRDMELSVVPIVNTPITIQATIAVLTNNLTSWQQVWNSSMPHPDIYLSPGEDLFIQFAMSDPDLSGYPYSQCYSESILNSNASISSIGYSDWAECDYNWTSILPSYISNQPYFVTFRTFERFYSPYYDKILSDYTFRIFVSQNTTYLNEVVNMSNSVYLKSVDLLGREKDPNLPGFRIDIYSDGKTKKIFKLD
jgi:hypothetical protein